MSTPTQTGEVTLSLGGKPRTVAFTMGALLEYVGLQGGDLSAAIDSLGSGNPDAITPLVYCGLKVRRKVNALPADFDLDTAREWVAEVLFLRPDELTPLMEALTASFQELGNRKGLPTEAATAAPGQA
ncbi:hypothetical protein LJY25_14775 [Hymenobacter sp. BT175]|uniref:hypothetical protein n=1 Tax=Hymenobacter translucens TaxID=2886507 RepID=UPI001D0EE497|nr:hypothetical protein [Hymenobacter translucens]MCC2547717.1 hypothetical protein [Hymenobacter translucens]